MTTPLDHARDLLRRGLLPIPVPFREKGPRIAGWQNLRLSDDTLAMHFNGQPLNVGALLGEPSGWIVDVDLDHPRAVELADSFLPQTRATWGRDGKPRSHRLYRLTGPGDTRKWTSKAGMIVELRATGCQTIAPGSMHPSGEVVRWYEDGVPALIDPEELAAAVDKLAGAVLAELGVVSPPATWNDVAKIKAMMAARAPAGWTTPYGREALRREAAKVAATPEGARNDALNEAAFAVGTLIGAGEVARSDAEAALRDAARSCGLSDPEAERTIKSGIEAGIQNPRRAPEHRRKGEAGKRPAAAPKREPVAPFTPFPIEVLPEPIRSFVAGAAKAIGCDPCYIALPTLAGLASAIGNTYRIALKRGWTEPAIVWTAIVGESGTAKSPAIELALRPIRKRQHEALKHHAAAMEEYREALAIHERDAAHWKRGKSDDPPPEKPEHPIADRCWTDDTTTEALAVLLQQNPRGLLMARDELAGWIGGFDCYTGGRGGGKDAAKWLEMFGGRPMVVDRKTGGILYVPRAAVSIAGGIQPETLRRSLGQEHRDNGLAARLLLSCPPRKAKQWTEADIDDLTVAAIAAVFDRLYALTPDVDGDGDFVPRLIRLSAEGRAAWVAFYNTHAAEQAELTGDLSAAWSKLEGYAARLALVVHLAHWAAIRTDAPPGPVDGASTAAGVALARWFGDEAKRVYAILGESDGDRERRHLLEWIERKGGRVTVRDVTHGLRKYRSDPEGAEDDLGKLVEAGAGRWEQPAPCPKGGQPAKVFSLVTSVTVTTTPVFNPASVGNGDGDSGDGDAKAGNGLREL